jgi:hypothetical protein
MLTWACEVHAGPPTPPTWTGSASTIPKSLSIVGMSAAGADVGLGNFHVFAAQYQQPSIGTRIAIDLRLVPGVRIAASQPDPLETTRCDSHAVYEFVNEIGIVDMTVVGSSSGAAVPPGPSIAKIFADGIPFGEVPVAIYDLDGSGGLGAGDLSIWLSDYGSGQFYGRDDYDFDGVLGTNDLSLWLTAYGTGASSQSGLGLCP